MGNARDRRSDNLGRGQRLPPRRADETSAQAAADEPPEGITFFGHRDKSETGDPVTHGGVAQKQVGDSHEPLTAPIVLARTPPPANDIEPPGALLAFARDLGALAAALHWEGLLTPSDRDSPSRNLENSGNKIARESVNREGER